MDPVKLEEALTFVEHNFGMEWLKDSVDSLKEYDPERTTTGRYIDLWHMGISPLAVMWYKGRESMALYQLNGQLPPSVETLLLDRLISDIRTSEKAPGFDLLLEPLKDNIKYAAAAYEINIAAGFIKLGHSVAFTKDLGIFRVSTQDLTVAGYKLPDKLPGNNERTIASLAFEPAMVVEGNKKFLFYFDVTPAPGEMSRGNMEKWLRLLKQNLPEDNINNAICTTTVLGKDSYGYFLLEESRPIGLIDKDLQVYLPNNKRGSLA